MKRLRPVERSGGTNKPVAPFTPTFFILSELMGTISQHRNGQPRASLPQRACFCRQIYISKGIRIMSRHTIVLEKALPDPKLFGMESSSPSASPRKDIQRDIYHNLAATLFRPNADAGRSVIIFCSPQQGTGVSSIVRGVANSLMHAGRSVGVFDQDLRSVQIDGLLDGIGVDDISILGAPSPKSSADVDGVSKLRDRFECVLIDCGSVEINPDMTRLASFCDGVVLVVEAGRTSAKLLQRAQHGIERAHGRFLGVVLNKRRYPIPSWLHKILHAS